MKCKNKSCRTCKHHEFKTATVDEHRIVYCHYCSKYGGCGDSFVELMECVGESVKYE